MGGLPKTKINSWMLLFIFISLIKIENNASAEIHKHDRLISLFEAYDLKKCLPRSRSSIRSLQLNRETNGKKRISSVHEQAEIAKIIKGTVEKC